jgi:hypothetical protein
MAKVGVTYQSEQDSDGTWTVRDVPIFAEISIPTGRDKAKLIDETWLKQALATSGAKAKSGYLAPLHIGHHGCFGGEVPDAGKILPVRVAASDYNGEKRAVLYADLVEIPDDIYQRMAAGRLPYRSVEINDIDEPEISSLALMQSSAPQFQFPLLRVAKGEAKTFSIAASAAMFAASAPAQFAMSGNRLAVSFSEEIMADDPKKPDAPAVAPEPAAPEVAPEVKAMLGDADILAIGKAMTAAISAAMTPLAAKLDELLVACGGGGSEPAMGAGGAPAAGMSASAGNEPAALAGQVAALAGQVKMMGDDAKREKSVKAALARLAGYALPTDIEVQLSRYALAGGDAAVTAFCDAVMATGTKEPPTSSTAPAAAGTPAEVLAYQSRGPEALKLASRHHREWLSQRAYTRLSAAEYLRINMDVAPQMITTRAKFDEE